MTSVIFVFDINLAWDTHQQNTEGGRYVGE